MDNDMVSRRGPLMQGYGVKDTTEAQAREDFRKKFGREPQKCFRRGPIWVAGPISLLVDECRESQAILTGTLGVAPQ